jgi:hypothetical protein
VLLDLAWTRPRSSTLPAAVANGRLLVAVPASSLESRRGGAEQKWVAAAVGEGGERKAGRGEVDRFGLERRSRGREGQKGEQVTSPPRPRRTVKNK